MKHGRVIDVGGAGDCGFLSIAAGLIDLYLNEQLNQSLAAGVFNEFFKRYAAYFPSQMPANKNASAREIFEHLIKTQAAGVLVQSFAYVLRQYAVDIIVKNPADYRGAFIEDGRHHLATSPAEMRKPGTWISETEIAALAKTFKIPTVVKYGAYSGNLYNGVTQCQQDIEIHLNGGHYQPKIQSSEYFQASTHQAVIPAAPERVVVKIDPTLEEIKALIAEAEACDLRYEENIKAEMNKYSDADLIKIYQRVMVTSDYLPGKINEITKEHNGDLFFFNAIINNRIEPARKDDIRAILLQALAKQAYITPSFNHATIYQAIQKDAKSQQSLLKNSIFATPNTCNKEAQLTEVNVPQIALQVM